MRRRQIAALDSPRFDGASPERPGKGRLMNDATVASTTDTMEDVTAAAEVTVEELAEGRLPERSELTTNNDEESEEPRPKVNKLQRRFDALTREKYEHLDRIKELEARLWEVDASARREPQVTEPESPTEKENVEQPANEPEKRPEAPRPDPAQVQREAMDREVHARFSRDFEAALPKGSADRQQLEEAARQTEAEVGGIHPGVARMVMAMPNSVDVYAHLCTHPYDLQILNASRSEVEALANVRYMSGVLRGMAQNQNAAPSARPRVNRPPEPVKPSRGGAPASSPSLEESDYQTFKRVREQQEKSYRRGR
jgi:hypothetical protein